VSAGSFPAGTEPAGAAPVETAPNARSRRPAAIRYEGVTRDWVIQAETGSYKAVTPVEQAVVLSLMVRQGQITSAPTVGHTLHEIETLDELTIEADATDRVRRANPLARLVRDGEAAIKKIDVQVVSNQLRVAVYFVDLTRDKNRLLRADAALT
jgi:hypothetical protein